KSIPESQRRCLRCLPGCLPVWILLVTFSNCLQTSVHGQDDLPGGGQATPVESITLPQGFAVQLLRSAGTGEGSWISMTFDDRGRLILGRDRRGIARLTLSEDHSRVDRYEEL